MVYYIPQHQISFLRPKINIFILITAFSIYYGILRGLFHFPKNIFNSNLNFHYTGGNQMTVFSYSTILSEGDVKFLLDLLPKHQPPVPDIYIFDDWKAVSLLTSFKNKPLEQYNLLKTIVHNGVFSTYNYKYNMIFIYLFNLPYQDLFLIKLHGVYCLYHEMRHHQQFNSSKNRFLSQLSDLSSYSNLWVERDANKYAIKWMRQNRWLINDRFQLHHLSWEIRLNEKRRLRIFAI